MNWDAIGALGEIVGAFAVVISLIYVGIQIRQNTIATERSNARQTASDHERALAYFADKEMAEINLKAIYHFDELSEVEQYRYDLLISVWLETIEQAYADASLGSFPKEQLRAYENRLFVLLATPGGKDWWERRQVWFSPTFRAEVERLLARGVPEEMIKTGLVSPPNRSVETGV